MSRLLLTEIAFEPFFAGDLVESDEWSVTDSVKSVIEDVLGERHVGDGGCGDMVGCRSDLGDSPIMCCCITQLLYQPAQGNILAGSAPPDNFVRNHCHEWIYMACSVTFEVLLAQMT